MALDIVTLALAKKYTRETAEGMGAVQGKPGKDGKDGKSAYQLAVDDGFTGTEQEWLASLQGPPGEDGKDGKDGADGKDGIDGKDGDTPYIGDNGNWWIGDVDTGVSASGGGGGGGEGTPSWAIGHGLSLKNNVLSALAVDDFSGDNTLPMTAAGVQTQVGNIEILLNTI